MARYCLDTRYRRTKCSDWRNVPPSWLLCILIQCFIALPCVSTNCMGVNIGVAIYPQGTISVRYGDPLEIFCIAESYTSDDLEFIVASAHLESQRINDTTRRVYIKNPEKQASNIYCRNKKTSKMCTTRILVESPPANVTDFECISRNLDVLNCSWTSPKTVSIVNYTLTFVIYGYEVPPLCIARTNWDTRTKYCTWNTYSQPRYRQIEPTLYFRLTSCNVIGCNYQNFTIDHYSIVKPDPPLDLRVVQIGPHSVVLKWTIPNNMVELLTYGVEHIIEYQIAKIDNTTYFHRMDSSMLPSKNKTYKFQLSNLPYAHMQYEVRIYIKSKQAVKHDYWSDYSFAVFYTASERPHRPPDMIAGAFAQRTFAEKRRLYIYWKQLEECEEAGADFTYKVLVTQGNQTFPIIYPDKKKSLSYSVIKEVSLEALNVNVWSVNANGSSLNSSHLYIPANRDIKSLGVTSFSSLSYGNGTYELYWFGMKNIDNYTLFWCHYKETRLCAGRIDFAVLDSKKNKYIIELPREYRYQFAISANNGTHTSGMVWTMCDIAMDNIEMLRFPVQLKYDAPGKSSVRLGWRSHCPLQNVITGYNISYCKMFQTSYCDESLKSKYMFIDDLTKTDVLIENLLPFTTYQFTLAINTTYGQKYTETTVITTSEDEPSTPLNVGVSDVRTNSLVISWDPPLERNGMIGKYVINNYDKLIYVDKVSWTHVSRREVILTGLTGFTNYSLTVQACNIAIGLCSKPGPVRGIFVRTKIGPPSALKAPIIKNEPDVLKWEPPVIPGGTVDLYQIRRVREEILNSTEMSYSVAHCEGVFLTESYQVRAVNFDRDYNYGVIGTGNVTLPKRSNNNTFDEYPGEWSPPSTVIRCTREEL